MDRCEFIFLNAFEYLCVCACVCLAQGAQQGSHMCGSHLYDNSKSTAASLCCLCGRDVLAVLLEASLRNSNDCNL